MLNFVREYKNKPCMDCKMSYPAYVMDLDHRDRDDKIGDMGTLIRKGVWKTLIAELEKCDVVCSNCHRIRTAQQMGWV